MLRVPADRADADRPGRHLRPAAALGTGRPAITITATDYRHTPNRTGQLSVQLPDALGRNQKIVIG